MGKYYVDVRIPDLSAFRPGFPGHYVRLIFRDNQPQDFRTRALTSTFIQLTETAIWQYENGRELIEEFWIKRDPGSIPIGSFIRASGYFESCITNMHRATECMIAIRGRRYVQQDAKDLLPKPIRFIQEPVAGRLRAMRNAVQHFERQILAGQPPNKVRYILAADGPEIEEGDDKTKLIDRLMIGEIEIEFSELCQWLQEMAKCAGAISNY